MQFLDVLASGQLGLIAHLPKHLAVTKQTETSAQFTDPRDGLGWWFHFFPDVRLDLAAEHATLLRRDVERHTRLLFESMFAFARASLDVPADAKPRTSDASWSPLVEVERIELEGGPALGVLHRMLYLRGRESIMGHTLIPVARGLFEARWMAASQTTGYRESVLMLKLNEGKETAFLPQAVYDDPAHDATFAQHPLTLARAAKRWHEAGCKITEPAPPTRTEDVSLAPLPAVVSVPPRFILVDVSRDDGALFCRASFAGTDGVDRLIVCRTYERIRGIAVARRLASFARDRARLIYERSGLTEVMCEALGRDGDPVILTEGESGGIGNGRARAVWQFFRDDDGYVWYAALATTVAVPAAEMMEDVASVVHSWRTV